MEFTPPKDTNEEKRNRVAAALIANPNRSDRIIMLEARVSQSTVFRMRRILEASGKLGPVSPSDRSRGRRGFRSEYVIKIREKIRNELLRDYTQSNKAIAVATETSATTVGVTRRLMEKAGEIKTIDVRQRKSIRGRKIYLAVPEGKTVVEWIEEGIGLEEKKGMTAEKVAGHLGIGTLSYRMARVIVLLSRQPNLSDTETKTVRDAISDMNKTEVITIPYEKIRTIAKRVWGKGRNLFPTDKSAAMRVKKFNHAVTVIVETCNAARDLLAPPLDEATIRVVDSQLRDAANGINTLRKRLLKQGRTI